LIAIVAGATALPGCLATKYQMAGKDTPPPIPLNLAASQPPVEMALDTVIVYKGAGSWKREALWDEYVVTIRNQGGQALTIADPILVDFGGASRAPGVDPWALAKESQSLEQRYKRAGIAFARSAAPGVLIVGAGAGAIASAGIFSAAAATAATATVIALPVYYVVIASVNHSNKKAIVAEFTRRRLVLPLTLEAGATLTGSFFFPMVPNPQSLNLPWSSGADGGELPLSLEPLHGLHVR
jgi:hypothetical protein